MAEKGEKMGLGKPDSSEVSFTSQLTVMWENIGPNCFSQFETGFFFLILFFHPHRLSGINVFEKVVGWCQIINIPTRDAKAMN